MSHPPEVIVCQGCVSYQKDGKWYVCELTGKVLRRYDKNKPCVNRKEPK